MYKKYLNIFLMMIHLSSFGQKKTYLLGVNKIDESKITTSTIDVSIEVLKKRLKKIGVKNPTIYFDRQRRNFVIETIDEIDGIQINNSLLKQYRASIFECYNTSDFLKLIQQNKSKKTKILSDSFLKQFSLPDSYGTSYIGIVNLKDISIANRVKVTLQDYYVNSLKLFYGKKEIQGKNDFVELYALKNNSSILEINKILDSASIGFDALGHPSLQLVFNSRGAKAFEKLTENNINKFLAIAIDELVILAPLVTGKIGGGRLEISGAFTIRELQNLKDNLTSGYLPIQLNFEK
jgi:preprotein translocase subunit SecD